MLNVLGVLAMVVYIVVVVSLAAGVTWLVVKFSPSRGAQRS
jgi:hypothetical protein